MKTILAYENLSLEYSASTVAIILAAIYVGIVFAYIYSIIDKAISNEIVTNLLVLGANSVDSALTLNEAGIKHKKISLYFLRKNSRFRKTIILANAEEFEVVVTPSKTKKFFQKLFSIEPSTKEELILEKAKFYIPEENRIHAEVSLKAKKKPSIALLIVGLLVFTGVMIGLYFAIPKLLDFLDLSLSSFKK